MIVLFDICGTLFDSNTTFDFLDYKIESKVYQLFRRFSKTFFWRGFVKIIYVSFGWDLTRLVALRYLKNINYVNLEREANQFYDNILLNKKIYPVWNLLEKYRDENHMIILASATVDFMANSIGQKLNIDNVVATDLQYTTNGKCKGGIKIDNLGNKLNSIKQKFNLEHFDITVTDNFSDVDIILASNKSYLVIDKKTKKRWLSIIRKNDIQNYEFIWK